MATFTGSQAYNVTSVSFGIETANASGTGTTQPINVRLHTQTTGTFPTGTRTQLGSTVTVQVADQTNTVLVVPFVVTVPAGTTELIMEINSPDGQTLGHSFFAGAMSRAQTGPSYISAAACGIADSY